MPASIEQIDLNARVHRHQHGEQGIACPLVGQVACVIGHLRPVFGDMSGQPVRQTLQALLFVMARRVANDQGDKRAVGDEQHGDHNDKHNTDGACPPRHAGTPSKR